MKKTRKIRLFFIVMIAVLMICGDISTVLAACSSHVTGWTCPGHTAGHSWETPSTCSTCGGDHKISCSTCGGDGKVTSNYYTCSNSCVTSTTAGKCPTCNKTMSKVQTSCSKCSGKGYSYCSRCYASGTYIGKNTKCTNSGCSYSSYAAWSDYPNGTCYTYTDGCTPVYGDHVSNGVYAADSSNHWTNCSYCGGAMGTTGHTSNGTYNYDTTNHWTFCATCGTAFGTTAHSYGSEWTSGGYRYQTCGCGYSRLNGPITYYVAYHGNGATSGSTSTSTHTYDTGGYLTQNGFARTGYTYLGWSTNSASTGATYSNRQYVSNLTQTHGGTVNLYAIWNANTYTINFNANGGTSGSITKVTPTYNSSNYYSYGGIVPSRVGYTFKGFYTATSGGVQVYQANGVCTNGTGYWSNNCWVYANNVTLYAQWEKQNYNIVYNINGGNTLNGSTSSSITKTIKYEDAVDLTVSATRNKMKFIGWGLTPNATEPIESIPSFLLTTGEAYASYVKNNTLNLYAIYSYEVSDIKGCTFAIWNTGSSETVKSTYKEYPMSLYQVQQGGYIYALRNMDVTSSLTSTDWAYTNYCVYVEDNAGNVTPIDGTIPSDVDPVVYYEQTIKHMVWNMDEQTYIEEEREIASVRHGQTYTPQYLDSLLTWNDGETKPEAYKVTGKNTIEVKYKPKAMTVVLDPQGGTVAESTITTYMNTLYGSLPTATKEGYTHKGWYTQPNGLGVKVGESDRYPYPNVYPEAGPTTLYAKWEVNYYPQYYDYWTNGGTEMDDIPSQYQYIAYGEEVFLDLSAFKEGWGFIGWNTDDEAKEGLTSFKTGVESPTLYAIFKKTITCTLIDLQGDRTLSETIYNKDANYVFELPSVREEDGWKELGWSTGDKADSLITAGSYSNISLAENVKLYALYEKDVTVSYDTGNENQTIVSETLKAYLNSSGDVKKATFTVQSVIDRDNYQFMYWYDEDGNQYQPGDVIELTEDIHLTAYWDEFPDLIVYERYFTLWQAQSGVITETELLVDVTVTDKEDDAVGRYIKRGVDGVYEDEIKNLTNSADIRVTYWVEDSVGNRVKKEMIFHVVKSDATIDTRTASSRFINSEYYNTDTAGVYVSEADGGIKDTSAWKTNSAYSSLLTNTLATTKSNMTFKELVFGNSKHNLVVESSGEWNQIYSSHTYSAEDIAKIKEYVNTNGYSRFENEDATETFIQNFMRTNETE